MDSVLAYVDVSPDDDAGWVRAWDRLRMAARRYTAAVKGTEEGQAEGVHVGPEGGV